MEIKGKVNTDTINVHKGELMEYKNQTENRAFQEMLQAAVKRLQNRSGEDIATKSGAVFHDCSADERQSARGYAGAHDEPAGE